MSGRLRFPKARPVHGASWGLHAALLHVGTRYESEPDICR